MQEYCYKCMRPLNGSMVCSHCGFDNAAGQGADAPYHLLRGTMLSGRYLVGKVLGEGGFGITYIGLDTTLSKRVAIKEFYPSGAANRTNKESSTVIVTQGREVFFSKGVERFLFEAKNVAAFSEEEGIVDVLDYFQANGTAYIVMEFLNGETLKDYVNSRGCFKLEELVPLMLPVMRSLGIIHAKGIIHRDISPDNLMLTKRGKLKLMDFGSARYYTNEERKMSVILKQGFAPEEQYRQNGEQGPHTDVYALCATIYACITGTVPVSSLDRLVEDTLQPPSQLGVPVLPYQEQALMHGLALSRKNRTPDMETLIREFTTKPAMEIDRTVAADNAPVYPPAQPRKKQSQQEKAKSSWRKSDKAAPPQPPQPPVPPQPPQKPQKPQDGKKSKMPLIIAAVAGVLVIGGGIIAGITIFGGNKPANNNAASQSTMLSSSASSSSAVQNSGQSHSSMQQSSRQLVASKLESSKTASNNHALYNESGVFLLENDAIDTEDVSAEMKLRNYASQDLVTMDEETKKTLSINYFVRGNVFVEEVHYKVDLSDELKKEIIDSTKSDNESVKSAKKTLIESTGVSNAQYVNAVYDKNGELIASCLIED